MSICLCMVVKNEAELIREALRSAKPFIDEWSIMDTESTDTTLDIVHEEMKGISGAVHHEKWEDYGTTRTKAIESAKQSGGEWLLLLDADETLIVPNGFKFENLDPNNSYWMTVKYANISYSRPNLLNVQHNWRYVGVTHEYLMADPMPPAIMLPITIMTHPTRCTKSLKRCKEDIDLLYKGLAAEPNNSRYVFYLAQSYRDANDHNSAILHYKRRVAMGGWYEEAYYAQFQVALLMERLEYPRPDIVDAYIKAYNMNPDRAESLGSLARYLRIARDFQAAYFFAQKAKNTPRPNQLLFVDDTFYQWRNQDELAVSAYWIGRYGECLTNCEELLKSGNLPEHERARVEANKQHALNRLKEGK